MTYNDIMNNITPPDLALTLPFHACYQRFHTLAAILPPPVNDTPEALLARTYAAMDKVGAMLPTNANEADLAAQCVAMRAQAEDVLLLLRKHKGDLTVEMKLNAQYNAMVRTSMAVLGRLQRTQAIRHKREANDATLKADEWTQHVAVRSMQQAMDAGPAPAAPAAAPSAPAPLAEPSAVSAPEPAPVAPKPAPALAAAPPSAPEAAATQPRVSAPVAPGQLAQAAPGQIQTPLRSHRIATPAEADEPPRNLPTEAEQYALTYPLRPREMRQLGGLPPNCSYGPPDDELVRAVVTGNSQALRALDDPKAGTL